ncbi:MAG: hypothetical protein JXQ67_10270 [Campylobacterales bacterium]|nr:hypothetical protein [Campylobacterales bacterium]
MRSRDGNHSFTLSISAIIFLFNSLALHAGEYLISYNYSVKNAILYNEQLDISKSMQTCKGTLSNSIIFPGNDSNNLYEVIETNRENFIEFLHSIGLLVEHREETNNYQNNSITHLTLRTRCFKVDFNDTLVKISALK